MKLIANLDIPANMAVADVEMLESLPNEEFIARAGQEIEFEYVEGLGYESEEINYLMADPVIDGLFLFHHPEAPWGQGSESVAKDLNEKWISLLKECYLGLDMEYPSKRMIGTLFIVRCWKEWEGLCEGVYTAAIEDSFSASTDGFVIEHDNKKFVVDTVKEVINHFVLV